MRFDKRKSKKSKSGFTWRVTFDYRDEYGQKQRYSKSGFKTKKEAEAHGRETLDLLDQGAPIRAQDLTLNDLFDKWNKVTTLKENSLYAYKSAYTRYCSQTIGESRVKDLDYTALQAFFNTLSGVGKGAVRGVHKVLSSLFKLAIKSKYIQSSAIDLVDLTGKEVHRDQEEYISKPDFDRLVTLVSSRTPVFSAGARAMTLLLGYYAGLRIGEIAGLMWEDVDLSKKQITIHRQLIYNGRKKADFEIAEYVKTDASRATIPIPDALADALEEWRAYNPYDLVVCYQDGSYLIPANVREAIRPIAKSLGVAYHPHMLRHTYVTNLILSGADPATAAKLARHSDITTTLKIYTEINAQRKEEAIRQAFGEGEPTILA